MYHANAITAGGMFLEGLTVSVNYADFLDETLTQNLGHFDEFAVVTARDDRATQAVCDRHGVICVKSDVYREDPLDHFNKGLMINLGLAHLRNRGWLLHLDADIVLPDRLRFILNKSRLDEDCLYGADRVNVVGRGPWEALERSAAYQRQYRHRYLVSPVGSADWLAADSQRVRLLPHRLFPALAFEAWPTALSLFARFGGAFRRALRAAVAGRPANPAARPVCLSPGIRAGQDRPNWNGRVTRRFTKS